MKNIVTLIHDDSGQDARLQAALDVTRAVGGHLLCVHVTDYPPIVGDATGMSGAVMVLEVEEEVEAENRAKVEKRLAVEDVTWAWVEVTGEIGPAIEENSELADLIVLNTERSRAFQPDTHILVERLAVRSGKPVLAVRDDSGFHPSDPVLIAWDGSDPAAKALRAAVPLLRLSESVTVYEIDDGSVEEPADLAAAYLSRYGIRAEILREKAPDGDFVEPLLLQKLESGRFGWAVMGAFSRSRFREALFGGVTKRMLKEAPVPLFIAH